MKIYFCGYKYSAKKLLYEIYIYIYITLFIGLYIYIYIYNLHCFLNTSYIYVMYIIIYKIDI